MKKALAVLLVLLACARFAHAEEFFLRDKDTVVFYGDSITAQRLYTTHVESFVATHCPDLDVRFVHSGWGGDTVRGGAGGAIDKRLERDVIAWKPTVVTIMLGMNDASYRAFDEKVFETYRKGYEHIVATLKEKLPDARLVLIEPSPFDDVTRKPQFEGGYNAVLVRYGAFVRELAKKEGLACVDLNGPLRECLEKANKASHETAQKIVADRVHPGPAGQLVMAKALLEGLHAPGLVSDVTVDLGARKVVKAENASVADVGSLSWTQTDRALPVPTDMKDAAVALAARSSDLDAFDRQVVKVLGLTDEKYELAIDGVRVGDFTRAELEAGVNLARLATPMQKQAQEVFVATRRKGDVFEARWRQLVVALEGKAKASQPKALEALSEVVEELREEVRAAAKPKAHRFSLAVR